MDSGNDTAQPAEGATSGADQTVARYFVSATAPHPQLPSKHISYYGYLAMEDAVNATQFGRIANMLAAEMQQALGASVDPDAIHINELEFAGRVSREQLAAMGCPSVAELARSRKRSDSSMWRVRVTHAAAWFVIACITLVLGAQDDRTRVFLTEHGGWWVAALLTTLFTVALASLHQWLRPRHLDEWDAATLSDVIGRRPHYERALRKKGALSNFEHALALRDAVLEIDVEVARRSGAPPMGRATRFHWYDPLIPMGELLLALSAAAALVIGLGYFG